MVAAVHKLSPRKPWKISFSKSVPAAPEPIEAGELTRRQVEQMIRELYGNAADDAAESFSAHGVHPGQDGSMRRGRSEEVVLVRDIPITSCEHHLLPCVGKAHVAYLAGGRSVSAAQLARTLDAVALRIPAPQQAAGQFADAVALHLTADAVAVVVEMDHVCIEWSDAGETDGGPAPALRGRFESEPALGAEVVALLLAPAYG